MVSLVLVSHSLALAESLLTLMESMVNAPVKIAVAAGVDDPENPWGTDVIKIQAAIESVYTDDGVIILMDLGSAILSAEMAVEFFEIEQQNKIKLCAAPLVEGAIAAAIMAGTGASLEEVMAEAQQSLTAKLSQLEPPQIAANFSSVSSGIDTSLTKIFQINFPDGLHLRPAAEFVRKANEFTAKIQVRKTTGKQNFVEGKSLNQLMLLGVKQGEEIEIEALGDDATLALTELEKLIEKINSEINVSFPSLNVSNQSPNLTKKSNKFQGIPASPGLVRGLYQYYEQTLVPVDQKLNNNSQLEWQNFQKAIQNAQAEIESLARETKTSEAIFQSHILYLNDPQLQSQTKQLIFEQQYTAAFAWKSVIEQAINDYQTLETEYLRARVIDLQDIGNRVLKNLLSIETIPLKLEVPSIIIATQLTPSQVAQLNPQQVLGIATVTGSATDHSAIVASLLGIPMVVGLGDALLTLTRDTMIQLDGSTGFVALLPSSQTTTIKPSEPSIPPQPAITRDGHSITLMANIIGVADAQKAMNYGACGVGLLRTEFLYLGRPSPPTESEQVSFYQAIAAVVAPYPLTIRTIDLGGDKRVSYLPWLKEENPFLGKRGIRVTLAEPDLFKTQLSAILRVSSEFNNIRLMLPMISRLQEVQLTKQLLQEVKEDLQQENIPFNEDLSLGIMLEVPSAIVMAEQLASDVDFFSIGTNDLTQYLMAADRSNPDVVELTTGCPPALLTVIKQTVEVANQKGTTVSICGQLASSPEAIPILLGLGVKQLSINPPMIVEIREIISQLSL